LNPDRFASKETNLILDGEVGQDIAILTAFLERLLILALSFDEMQKATEIRIFGNPSDHKLLYLHHLSDL
jgi:hypothetical protein